MTLGERDVVGASGTAPGSAGSEQSTRQDEALGRFASDSARMAIGTAVAQGILLAFTPILGRLYSPEAVGRAAPVYALATVLGVIAAGRLELAIMLPTDRGRALSVLRLALLVTLALGAIGTIVAAALGGTGRFGHSAWVVPAGILAIGASSALTYWLLRERRFESVARARIVGSLITVAIQWALALAGRASDSSLLLGYLASPAAVALYSWASASASGDSLFETGALRHLPDVASTYRRFPLLEAWGALVGTLGTQVPVLLLGALYPAAAVGRFSMATRLLTAPVSFVGSAVGQVYFQRAAALDGAGRSIRPLTVRLYRWLVAVGIGPFLAVGVLGPSLFAFLLGADWLEAGKYASAIAAAAFFQFTYNPLSTVFAVRKRLGSLTAVHLLLFAVPTAALLLGRMLWPDDMLRVVWLFGTASAALYGALSFWNLRVAADAAHRGASDR